MKIYEVVVTCGGTICASDFYSTKELAEGHWQKLIDDGYDTSEVRIYERKVVKPPEILEHVMDDEAAYWNDVEWDNSVH